MSNQSALRLVEPLLSPARERLRAAIGTRASFEAALTRASEAQARLRSLVVSETDAAAAVDRAIRSRATGAAAWARGEGVLLPPPRDPHSVDAAKADLEAKRQLADAARGAMPQIERELREAAETLGAAQGEVVDAMRGVLAEEAAAIRERWRAAKRAAAEAEGELWALLSPLRSIHRNGEPAGVAYAAFGTRVRDWIAERIKAPDSPRPELTSRAVRFAERLCIDPDAEMEPTK